MWLRTGVSIIGVHPTNELNNSADGRTIGDEPRMNVVIHPATRQCHFTVVSFQLYVCFAYCIRKMVNVDLYVFPSPCPSPLCAPICGKAAYFVSW